MFLLGLNIKFKFSENGTVSSTNTKTLEMIGNYYDVDDILAECEELECKLETTGVNLGYLDDSNDNEDVSKISKTRKKSFRIYFTLISRIIFYI